MMLPALSLIAGAMLAFPLVYIARRRSPERAPRIYAVGLVVAALIDVGFAAFGGASARWVAFETVGVVGFGAIAWMGLRRGALLLGAGWAGHVLWDVLLHLGDAPGAAYTPAAYPWLCLSFDLIVAGAVLTQRHGARGSFGNGRTLALATLAIVTQSVAVGGQGLEAWFGAWTLNLSKSTYVPGPPPYTRARYVIEPWSDGLPAGDSRGVKVTYDMVYPRGGTTHLEWIGKFDGMPYQLQGVDEYVTYAYRRIDDRTYEVIVRIDDRLAASSKVVLSADGATMTTTTAGRDASGRAVTTTTVYEKRLP